MYDIVALGELLVDFTPCGVSAQELPVYQADPGGAPCNVPLHAVPAGAQDRLHRQGGA